MNRPILLDLYCKAGGAARGYQRAGFYVVGVDIEPQPRYAGDEFVQADALEYLAEHGHRYDAIHASPPCQGYSIMRNLPWLSGKDYPLLILPTREMLVGLGKPWVIENVYGARNGSKGLKRLGIEAHGMKAQWLCGSMFGLPMYRHRLFETPFFWMAPAHAKHRSRRPAGITDDHRGRGVTEQIIKNPVNSAWRATHDGVSPHSLARWQGNGAQVEGVGIGHAVGWRRAAEAMGIDWMKRDELTQAIPPVFTEYVGRHLFCEAIGGKA